jgi:hypothetical protein
MNSCARVLIGLASILCFPVAAQAATVHPKVQQHCVHDYKKFCHPMGHRDQGPEELHA